MDLRAARAISFHTGMPQMVLPWIFFSLMFGEPADALFEYTADYRASGDAAQMADGLLPIASHAGRPGGTVGNRQHVSRKETSLRRI